MILVYYLMSYFSLQITKTPGEVSAFFIPSGLSIALLIFFGIRYLPIIFLAKLVVGLSLNRVPERVVIAALGSCIEAYIGLYLYNSFKDSIEEYFEYQSNLILTLLIGLVPPIFGSIIGVTNLYYFNIVTDQNYFAHLFTWYTGDLLGVLIFLPLFLSFQKIKPRFFDFLTPLIALAFAYLFKFPVFGPYLFVLFFAIFIPTILNSIMGLYYTLITVSLILNWFLINHIGPFSLGNHLDNVVSMQCFLLAFAVTALSLEGFKKTNLLKSALVPLLCFWFLTGSVYYYYYTEKNIANNKVMSELIEDFQDRLTEKMNFYQNSINGVVGFVNGSVSIESAEWDEYVKSLAIVDQNHGMRGLGIIFPPYNKKSGRYYVYPKELDKNSLFSKMASHPDLQEVFKQSPYLFNAVLSPTVKLKLDDGSEKSISLLVKALKKGDIFIGWIVAPVEVETFFKSFIESRYPNVDVDIYDGEKILEHHKIYAKIVDPSLRNLDSNDTRLSHLVLAGRLFTINWNETLRYVTNHSAQNTLLILVGAIFSVVLTGFITHLKLINVKANKIANSKTFELRESEERFKSLFENSSDAVILFNNVEIIDCNPESLELFGKRSKKEVLDTPLLSFFSIRDLDFVDDKEFFKNKVLEVKYKKMVKFECFCLRAGLPFVAEMHLHYIEVNDKFIFQAVVRDISERKKIEQNLTKSKELAEEAARTKSNFLSTMSHEIRTPLNGVIGMVNIILDEHPKSQLREDLETIKYSADNLLHIVNEVLDYNKIESGKIVLEKNLFSLKNLCENILKIHRPKAMEKNLKLLLEFDTNIPDLVIGDEFRNTQILNNLLGNSLKFTDTGEVLLYARLKQKKEDSCVIEFKVSDTGIGIEKNKQREIFKDFTQAESDHTRKYGGTGLGLAITKRLVEIQNGKIDVISNNNQGTSFIYTIHFNLKPEVAMNALTHPNSKGPGSFNGERVLLVEDNQVNIIVTKKFLEKWGLKVDVAINGLEAVNHVRTTDYNLVLMDLHMPLMDGFEATKKIREFNKDTPIIGLSADVMTESVSSLQSIGMNDFVTKPFRPNDFFNKLKTYI